MVSEDRVCIIGAGAAGLCALKYALQQNLKAIAYEQGNEIGGTWVYSSSLDSDNMNDDVHSSMYEGLCTNLPKEIMAYSDFDYDVCKESYIGQAQVLKYLQDYAKHFKLISHIRLQHEVIRVCPKNSAWQVIVRNTIKNTYHVETFDFILICNGHYSAPNYPNIPGMKDVFEGKQMHSHTYRKAEHFKNLNVLIMGLGPSALDICKQVHQTAKRVFLSHHVETQIGFSFMQNVTQKPDPLHFTKTGAIFQDGTEEHFDTIIYCTGYNYQFPFLSIECGLHVEQNYVQPLYKHCININQPKMAFIGLPFLLLTIPSFDLQAQFVMKFFTKSKQLPSRALMLTDMKKEEAKRTALNWPKHKFHQMKNLQYSYYKDLADIAEVQNIKPAVQNLLKVCVDRFASDLKTFRNWNYKIIDDNNYEENYSS